MCKIIINLFIAISLLKACDKCTEHSSKVSHFSEQVHAEVGIANINIISKNASKLSFKESERIEEKKNVRIDIYSINRVPIAGVQFEIEPNDLFKIDSISGGICSEVGFSLYSNEKGVLLGFSLQGKKIPKSTSSEINDNILFSVFGKQVKDIPKDQIITLKTTLAGKKGNKINAKVNEYIYK